MAAKQSKMYLLFSVVVRTKWDNLGKVLSTVSGTHSNAHKMVTSGLKPDLDGLWKIPRAEDLG